MLRLVDRSYIHNQTHYILRDQGHMTIRMNHFEYILRTNKKKFEKAPYKNHHDLLHHQLL